MIRRDIMKTKINRLPGMYDLLPERHQQQRWIADQISTFLAQAGYASVRVRFCA